MTRLLSVFAILVLASCSELRVDPDCYPNNEVIHEADNWRGRVLYSDELSVWMIDYFVPGSIDSFYTGVVCNMPEEFKEEQLQVIYSGYLKDDKGKIRPSMVTGGQEFYFLDLISIELAE